MTSRRDKRQNILDTTLRLIVKHGLEATPMSLIGRQAHVGMGTIYHYFPSKESLVNVLYGELKVKVNQAMLHNYKREAPVRERFFQIWRNLFHFYLENPDAYRFLEQYSVSPIITAESRAHGMKLWEEPIRVFEDGKAHQVLKPLDIYLLALIANAPLLNLVNGHLAGQIVLDDRSIEAAIIACWDAIKL
jgi:TetR/AcrR family transcriptional regulator, repressor of fatR-cypB operon